MEYSQLRSFGQINTALLTPKVMLASFVAIPRELGFIGTPKFVAKMASKERYWKKRRFKTAVESGLTHEGFIQGIKYGLAFYQALVSTCGKEKTLEVYPRLTEKVGTLQWEEFLPPAKDFLSFQDPWEAIRQYWHEYFRSYEREGGMRYELVQDTDTDLQFRVTECAWHRMWSEGGCPELAPMSAQADVISLKELMAELGGDFKREAWLCNGDNFCDWHFCRHGDGHRSVSLESHQTDEAAPT